MPEIPIDRAIQSLESGRQQHDRSTRRQDGCHGRQRFAIVRDMLQYVQAHAGVRAKPRQSGEFVAAGVAYEGMQVGPIRISFDEPFDAIALHVEGDDGFAVEQRPGEIAEAATHLHYATS